MLHKVTLILSVLVSCLAQSETPPQSSCPAVFRYSYSPSQGWHGIISIVPPLTFSDVHLKLRLSLSNYLPNKPVGKVEILGGETEVQNIADRAGRNERQRIQYLVVFPSYDQFPRISSVKINENEFCSSPAYPDSRGVIDLKYTLKTGLPVAKSNGNEFSAVGAMMTQPQLLHRQKPHQPQQQQWQQPTQAPKEQKQHYRPSQQFSVAETPTTEDPEEAYLDLIKSVTQPPTPVRSRHTEKPTSKPTPRTTTDSDDYQYPDTEDDPALEYQVNEAECGRPSVAKVNTLVVRGEGTERGEWPWMAAMYLISDKKFRCAGSLISRRHVVTAAHCVTDGRTKRPLAASSFLLRLGRYDLDKDEPDEQIRTVSQILSNPKYRDSKKHDYDIAFMMLETAAVINNFVKPVCLWDESVDPHFEGIISKVGLAPGWGRDENGDMAKDMKLARMPVRTQSDCLESDPDFFTAIISDKTFCAGNTNGTTLCIGDSGGGLFFYKDHPKTGRKAWFVRGIVSLSKPSVETWCGETNYVVFTDIAKVMTWFKKKLEPPTPSR